MANSCALLDNLFFFKIKAKNLPEEVPSTGKMIENFDFFLFLASLNQLLIFSSLNEN